MKFLTATLLLIAVSGCKTSSDKTSTATIPESMSCPGSLDPNQACPDAVRPSPAAVSSKSTKPVTTTHEPANREITGTCEMLVQGEKAPRTCEDLILRVESIRGAETRPAQISGQDIRFTELTEEKYRFKATSDKYSVKAKTGELSPGQNVKIRVIANPKTKQ